MGLLKDHLRCISEREWMWWRRLLNLAYEMTTECPFERWKYTELISLQKEIGNDDTAKQRPIQLMDCMANTWNAAGEKKLDSRRESEQYKSDMQVGFTRNKSPWHVHHRVYHTAMEGQRFNEYKGQFMYIALDDAMRCFDSVRDIIQAPSQGELGANMEHAERTAKDNATRMITITTADGPSEEILSWKRTIAIWLRDGKITREPDGILTNAEINKKVTQRTTDWNSYMHSVDNGRGTRSTRNRRSNKQTRSSNRTTDKKRGNIKLRMKVQIRDLDHRRNNESHHAKLPIGLPQGGRWALRSMK
jgi:hypothetical protein